MNYQKGLIPNKEEVVSVEYLKSDPTITPQIFNQILSIFKFLP